MEQAKIKKQKSNKAYGTAIVVGCFLLMGFIYAPSFNLTGLFFPELMNEFGASSTQLVLIFTICIVASMFGSALAGKILNKFNLKKVVSVLLAVTGLSYIGGSFVNSLWLIYLSAAVRGFCLQIVTIVVISLLMNNWFGKKMRGKILGIAMSGSGVTTMFLSPLTGWILDSFGWRAGYRFFALLSLILIPLVLYCFIRTPQEIGLKPVEGKNATADDEVDSDLHQGTPANTAVKMPAFWLLFSAFLLICGATQSWNVNNASFLATLNYSTSEAALVITIVSIGLTIGKFALGAICDKASIKAGITLSICAALLPFVVFTFVPSVPWMLYVVAPILGFGMATHTVIMPLIVGDFYGKRDYAVLTGYIQAGASVGCAVVPLLFSLMYDKLGSYTTGWIVLACVLSLAIVSIYLSIAIQKKQKLRESEILQAESVSETVVE